MRTCVVVSIAILASLLAAAAYGQEPGFEFQPRLAAGIMSYDFEQGPSALTSTLVIDGIPITLRETSGPFTFSATVPWVEAGAKATFTHFGSLEIYGGVTRSGTGVDLNDQLFSRDLFNDVASSRADLNLGTETSFDQREYMFSGSFSPIRRTWVIAGYVDSSTAFDLFRSGEITQRTMDALVDQTATGTYTGAASGELKQSGPFVGVKYEWETAGGPVSGTLSGNLAATFLDAELTVTNADGLISDAVITDNLTGAAMQLGDILAPALPDQSFFGPSTGVMFRVDWQGDTGVGGLSYSVNFAGTRVAYGEDDFPDGTVQRTFSFGAGLRYRFGY